MAHLTNWRLARKMTQQTLAELCGTSKVTIWRIESGKQWPSGLMMAAIYAATDGKITPSHILHDYVEARLSRQKASAP